MPDIVIRLKMRKDDEQAGVPEYWLIDPVRRQGEFYRIDEEGHYRLVTPEGGVYRSESVSEKSAMVQQAAHRRPSDGP